MLRAYLLAGLVGCLALPGQPLRGQVLRGVVVGEGTSGEYRPLEGARVELTVGSTREVRVGTTDRMGAFTFGSVGSRTVRLRVVHPGYLPFEEARVAVADGEWVALEIRLGRVAIPLEPLVVTARLSAALGDFHSRRRRGGLGSYLTRDEVEARGAGATTDLLRGLPGVRLRATRGSSPSVEMQGGFGPCQPGIFVDGLRMSGSAGAYLNDYLTPERIEGVEVYPSISTVPVQFQSGSCGAILFWTQRGDAGDGRPWSWWRMLLGVGTAVGLVLWIG